MATSGAGDGTVTITYRVGPGHGDPPITTVPASVTHQALPYTGAPVTLELTGSFVLLLAGAIAALSAHRRGSAGAGG